MGATDLNVGLDLSRSSWGLCNSSGSLAILDPSLPILTEQLGVFRDYRAHFEPIFFKFCGVCDFVFSNEIGCRKITQFFVVAREIWSTLSIAPHYSITSSAREISAWGMVTPSASAVLWLIINSTAVAC